MSALQCNMCSNSINFTVQLCLSCAPIEVLTFHCLHSYVRRTIVIVLISHTCNPMQHSLLSQYWFFIPALLSINGANLRMPAIRYHVRSQHSDTSHVLMAVFVWSVITPMTLYRRCLNGISGDGGKSFMIHTITRKMTPAPSSHFVDVPYPYDVGDSRNIFNLILSTTERNNWCTERSMMSVCIFIQTNLLFTAHEIMLPFIIYKNITGCLASKMLQNKTSSHGICYKLL